MPGKNDMTKSDSSRIQSSQATNGRDMSSNGFASRAQSAGDRNANANPGSSAGGGGKSGGGGQHSGGNTGSGSGRGSDPNPKPIEASFYPELLHRTPPISDWAEQAAIGCQDATIKFLSESGKRNTSELRDPQPRSPSQKNASVPSAGRGCRTTKQAAREGRSGRAPEFIYATREVMEEVKRMRIEKTEEVEKEVRLSKGMDACGIEGKEGERAMEKSVK
ncbi:hypothetical protein BDZ45DRAFT_753292 [Acephala macrosclerotiorum]|nr:hypothetical protein BDZ45DRAFT_753292 [Acephala macrosclerotiorum]